MLAPFWTDLDGTGAPGIFAAILTDGVDTWLVIEWQVNVFGTTSNRHFQVWIGVNGMQDISFTYDPAALPADPNGQAFLVGAENEIGEGRRCGRPCRSMTWWSRAPPRLPAKNSCTTSKSRE